ncbi:Arm DNA-binding domain-containing protein, partial [Propionivibrio sp.]|uniref:Arm DNA-binding domain-containing protein n=1 Tax=Propionivibrio sp. TaxID=2212460 RepID=UPI003BF15BE3
MERLTDREIKSFLNKEWGETKTRKLVDGEGLYLVIRKPNSPPTWRMDYKVANKSKTYTIGTYPDKSLAD